MEEIKQDIVQGLLDQLNSLSTVTETYELPTKGRLDNIGPEVTLRMMTTHEEKIRTGSKASFWRTMSNIINKCIVEPKGIDVYNLTVIDFIYLMYKLRILSYGSNYKVNSIICPECGQSIKEPVVNLDELEVITIDDYDKDFKEPFEVVLPKSKFKVGCRLLRMNEFDAIVQEREKFLEEFPNYEGDPSILIRLSRQIVTINGHEIYRESLKKIIDKLPASDENILSNKFESITMGMNINAKYTCPYCGKVIILPLSYSEEFFRPSSEQ